MGCACGHSEEEHGGDREYPGSTACAVAPCDCLAFEADEHAEDTARPANVKGGGE